MAELRDSSLLFSLESLMAEEQGRVARERVAKEQREHAEAAERESRVRIRLEEEALRVARERDRRLEEERRQKEEQARLEGIRVAEVERIRDEAGRKADAERAMALREHELRLATIRQAASARFTKMVLAGVSTALLAACTALAWLELRVHPRELAALQGDYGSTIGSERARADRAERLLGTSEAKRRELEKLLAARPVVTPEPPPPVPATRTPPSRRPGRPPARPGVRPPPCKDDNDPLNPCLGH